MKLRELFRLAAQDQVKYSNGIIRVDADYATERARAARQETVVRWERWRSITERNDRK